MMKEKYGRVVFMLTSNTVGIPAKYQSSYVTVKYALLGLMKALSAEYADKGITFNGVSPDMMETGFLDNIPDLIIEQNAQNSPLGRNIRIDEVIPVIEYMLSDRGAAMTGQNIAITGGI
jgi:3-oxoacyl-[acyl-carrier protein] reductase